MGDIDVNFNGVSDIAVLLDETADVAILFNPAVDIAVNIPSDLAADVYVAEYQVVYDSFTNKPTNPDDTRQNAWVEACVNDGLWDTKKDIQYNFAIHTNDDGEAQTNWLNPGAYDCTLVNAPAFVAFEGFTGDGATASIDWNWNPFANGINYTQNSASFGFYCRTESGGQTMVGMGADGTTTNLISAWSDNNMYVRINATSVGIKGVNLLSAGMIIAVRVDAVTMKGYRNKVEKVTTGSDAAQAPSNNNMFSLSNNDGSGSPENFSNRQHSMTFAGGDFTQTEVDNDTDNFETYMDAYGKGVIP